MLIRVRSQARADGNFRKPVCFNVPFFADLVVIARSLYPIPSRTRPSKSSAPMVLSLKTWKSRSLPGLPRTECFHLLITIVSSCKKAPRFAAGLFLFLLIVIAGLDPAIHGALPVTSLCRHHDGGEAAWIRGCKSP